MRELARDRQLAAYKHEGSGTRWTRCATMRTLEALWHRQPRPGRFGTEPGRGGELSRDLRGDQPCRRLRDRLPSDGRILAGFFARTWCADEFRDHGLDTKVAQANMSYNPTAGTLRGMHFQLPPAEAKLCAARRVRSTT